MKRKLYLKMPTAKPEPDRKPITIEESGASHINELPAFRKRVVLDALQNGDSHTAIAKLFQEQGWLTVSEKTFAIYLANFKRIYPDQVSFDNDNTVGPIAPRNSTINGIVNKIKPKMDEEKELEQLVRLQSVRIRIGVQFEQETGMVNKHLHHDIAASHDMLKTLAAVRGKLNTGAGRPGANQNQQIGNEAAEALRKSDMGEQAQDRMAGLVGKLITLAEEKNAVASS